MKQLIGYLWNEGLAGFGLGVAFLSAVVTITVLAADKPLSTNLTATVSTFTITNVVDAVPTPERCSWCQCDGSCRKVKQDKTVQVLSRQSYVYTANGQTVTQTIDKVLSATNSQMEKVWAPVTVAAPANVEPIEAP